MKKTPPTASEPAHAPGHRGFLYLTAGITGGAIMVVEILGAKMLSPYFGTSHFVWTAQIAVTLVALACGYYIGGGWVDRSPRLGRLYGAILVAGVYLAVTVSLTRPVAYGFLRFSLPVGSLLTAAVLFFVPLCLLAMTGPFLIRVVTVSVNAVGGNVGRLTAIGTLGSFVGTILIGYLLIPYLPNSISMGLTALLLLLWAAGYFAVFEKKLARKLAPLAGVAAGVLAGYAGWAGEQPRGEHFIELFRGNSSFGLLQVTQQKEGGFRYYLNDYLTQNTYDTNDQKSVSMFTYMLHRLARAYTTNLNEALCIGLGVGIVPMDLAREGVKVDVVEINPGVVPVARDYFNLQPDKLNLFLGDGRYYLNQCAKTYDAVILDAFLGDSSPSHLMTQEAFQAVRRVLKPDGTLVINTFGSFETGADFFAASLAKTLASVFPSVRIHAGRRGNTLFVASPRPDLAMAHPPDFNGIHWYCADEVQEAFASLRETHPGHGIVLRDDFNPVEYYDAANREGHRRYMAEAMRRL